MHRLVPPALLLLTLIGTARAQHPARLADEQTVGTFTVVAELAAPMPTGVTVSPDGRVFVNFPRWSDDVPFTVAEIRDGAAVAFPDDATNQFDKHSAAQHLVSVQSVVVDPIGRLWALDTGRPQWGKPLPGGPKLVGFDLRANKIFQSISIPSDVALDTTYLNDVRFDLTRGDRGMAFITDSSGDGPNAIIVVDLASGKSWRRLSGHPSVTAEQNFLPIVEGQPLMRRPQSQPPSHMSIGADGIAIGPDGKWLYYRPLSGRGLFRVSVDALADRRKSDEQVAATVETLCANCGFASDGLESDAVGALYLTNYEDNAIVRRDADGQFETILHDPRLLWPDTLALSADGWLFFTANQLHRQPDFHAGRDLRNPPYLVGKVRVDRQPVRLSPLE